VSKKIKYQQNGVSLVVGSHDTFCGEQVMKQALSPNGEQVSFPTLVVMASASGAVGGFIGVPADLVNVRMQNDIKLPKESRRK